jgi:hypothetical protein
MIQSTSKRYQIVLSNGADDGRGLQLEFDSYEEAFAEFERQRTAGRYGAGVLCRWEKVSSISELLARYPEE